MKKQTLTRSLALLCAIVLGCASACAEEAAPVGTTPAGSHEMPPERPNDGEGPFADGPDGAMGVPPEGAPGGFGVSGGGTQGAAATSLIESAAIGGGSFSSSSDNENALRIAGKIEVSLSGVSVDKSGGETSSTEYSDFYGQNAGLLATDGASVAIEDAAIATSASGGNAVFSHGAGTFVSIRNSTVRTAMDHSGGIHVTGGGRLEAFNLDVETQGASSAAIRSDRGGGTLTADGGTYTTNGTGSPAIYSTASVTARNATLTANHSEAVVVEGKNSVTLENCALSGSMDGTYGEDSGENLHAVMLYQSMSGDADAGQSQFSMTGGSLDGRAGDLFYVTNTACTIRLVSVLLTTADGSLLRVSGNDGSRGWGRAGENGGSCVMTADAQEMEGVITVDDCSALELRLENGSVYTGAINPDGHAGAVSVSLGEGSVWALTADAYISSFTGDQSQVVDNGFTLHIGDAP